VIRRNQESRGFALLVVLWVLAGTSSLAITVALIGRGAVDETSNEIAVVRSYWAAEECAAVLIDAAETALHEIATDSRDPQRVWRGLDRLAQPIRRQQQQSTCDARLESSGARLDLNRSSETDLLRFSEAIRIAPTHSDSLVAAILDWRDDDDVTRMNGAEEDWYHSRGLRPPRNGLFASEQELQFVRGFSELMPDQRALILAAAGVDADPIDLWHAPSAVLRSLPGFSASVTQLLMALRAVNPGVAGMPQLLAILEGPLRDSVVNHYTELVTRVETQPEHWSLIAEGKSGEPAVTTRVELLLGFGTTRLSVMRRR